jgi:hypothetical protein
MITQGKWISEASMSSSRFVRDILPEGETSVIAQVGGQGQKADIANAALIAAAPALLAISEALAERDCEYTGSAGCDLLPQGVVRNVCLPCQARQAIAAATK